MKLVTTGWEEGGRKGGMHNLTGQSSISPRDLGAREKQERERARRLGQGEGEE